MSQQQPTPRPCVSISVNGEERTIAPGCTVERLLVLLDVGGGRVAVAINRDVVPRSRYANHEISPGDRVEILEAVGGG